VRAHQLKSFDCSPR